MKLEDGACRGDELQPLLRGDVVQNCISMLEIVVESCRNRKKRMKVIKSVFKLLYHEQKHEFVIRTMNEDTFKQGRVFVAVTTSYYPQSVWLLVDFVFTETQHASLIVAAKAYPKDDVEFIVKHVALNYLDPDALLAHMRRTEVFENYAPEFEGKVKLERIKTFVLLLCSAWEMTLPTETRPLFIAINLKSSVAAYKRGEMEEQDLLRVCQGLAEKDLYRWNICIDIIHPQAPSLAAFVARRMEIKVRK